MFGLSKTERLVKAANQNDLNTVWELIAYPNLVTDAIKLSIRQNEITALKCLFEQSKRDINLPIDDNGNTWLHFAAQYGFIEVAGYFVNNGAEFDILNEQNQTPADIAQECQHTNFADFLKNDYPNDKLLQAAQSGDLEGVKYWVEEKYTDINADNQRNLTPLYLAIKERHKKVVDYLLHNDITVLPAIHSAMYHNDVPTLKLLIELSKIDIEKRTDDTQSTLLHMAVEYGHIPVVEYLLDIGANPKAIKKCVFSDIPFRCTDGSKLFTKEPTACDLAYHYGMKDLVAFMKRYAQGFCPKKEEHLKPTVWNSLKMPDANETTIDLTPEQREQYTFLIKAVKQLTGNSDDVKKMAVVGELCKIMESFDYEKSKAVYTEIAPFIDKSVQQKIETVIRNQR